MISSKPPGAILTAVLLFTTLFLLYGPLATVGDMLPRPGLDGEPVRVLVALESFRVTPSSSGKAEAAWLNRLVSRLERSQGAYPPVRVVERFVLERSVLGYGTGEEDERRLRGLAKAEEARFVVVASLSRLADRHSLDVRLLPTDGAAPLAHTVFEGEGVEGLASAVDRAAAAVRTWIAKPPLKPPAVELPAQGEAIARPAGPDAEEDSEEAVRSVSAPPPFEVEPAPEPAPEPPVTRSEEVREDGSDDADSETFRPRSPQPPSAGRPLVVEVRVVGNRRIEADAVRGRIATRVGEPYDAERVREDLRRVFELGFFRDVQVLASDRPDGKVVTFVVDENPIIRRVAVSGNDSLGNDEIKEQLTLTVGSTIDYPLLLENRRRIEALYQSKGFYLARVETSVEPISDDSVTVTFEVAEGRKLRLVEIQFLGNEYFSSRDLESDLDTKRWRFYSRVTRYFDRSGLYSEPVFYQDLDRVRRKYMDAGFIEIRMSDPEVTHDEEGLRVTVRITEGEQFAVGEVDVIGDDTLDRAHLQALVQMKPGDIFGRSTLTGDVERLRNHYADRGFFFARVEPRTRVDPATRTIDCTFEVEKGDLYFVDRIDVRGNTRTRDSVVRREFEVSEGALFSATALERSRARVRRLGFFEEVSVETRPLDDPHQVAVDVDVVERPTGSFSFGAGFGSTDGFLVNASIRQENLFGRGYQLNASGDLGTQTQNVYLRFTNPYIFGSVASLSTTLFMSERDFIDFDQEVVGFDFTVGYPLDEGETRAFGGYSYTNRSISGESVQATSMVQREEFQDDTITSMLTFSARRDTRDDVRFPKTGQVTGFALELAGLGGLTQFLRIEGRTTWFFPMKDWFGFDSTFIVNSRTGWTDQFKSISDFDLPGCSSSLCDDFYSGNTPLGPIDASEVQPLTSIDTDLKLPITERYFLGGVGAFQVRGFKQRSLGPRRSIIDQREISPGDLVFFASGRNLDGSCPAGEKCNSINDTDIDDFDDLDLADVIGGNKFFLLNLELQFPISEDLGLMGLVFLDMGNSFAEDEQINPADFRFGAGVGAQWFSPFGPILVQLGFPLDRLDDEDSAVFEFSLGGSVY